MEDKKDEEYDYTLLVNESSMSRVPAVPEDELDYSRPGADMTSSIRKRLLDEYDTTEECRSYSVPQNLSSFGGSDDTPLAAQLRLPGAMRRDFVNQLDTQEKFTETLAKTLFAGMFNDDGDELDNELFHSTKKKGLTTTQTTLSFLKGFVGAYVLYLPSLFHRAGFVYGTLTLLFVALIELYCIVILADTGRHCGRETYRGIAMVAFGKAGRFVVDVCLIASQMGYGISYFIFVADNLNEYLPFLSFNQILLVQLAFYIPLSLVRKMKYLSPVLILANICLLVGFAGIFTGFGSAISSSGIKSLGSAFHPSFAFQYFSSSVATFEGIGIAMPIYRSMEDRTQFSKIATFSFIFMVGFYICFSYMSVFAFGDDVETFITMNIHGSVGEMTSIVYSMAVLATYPLMMLPVMEITEKMVFRASHDVVMRSIYRTFLVCLTWLIAFSFQKSFDVMVSVVGALCATPLAVFFPLLFHLKIVGHLLSKKQFILDSCLVLFGAFAIIGCTYVTLFT